MDPAALDRELAVWIASTQLTAKVLTLPLLCDCAETDLSRHPSAQLVRQRIENYLALHLRLDDTGRDLDIAALRCLCRLDGDGRARTRRAHANAALGEPSKSPESFARTIEPRLRERLGRLILADIEARNRVVPTEPSSLTDGDVAVLAARSISTDEPAATVEAVESANVENSSGIAATVHVVHETLTGIGPESAQEDVARSLCQSYLSQRLISSCGDQPDET